MCRRFDFIHIALHCLLPENEREETNRFLNDTMGYERVHMKEEKEDFFSDSQYVYCRTYSKKKRRSKKKNDDENRKQQQQHYEAITTKDINLSIY